MRALDYWHMRYAKTKKLEDERDREAEGRGRKVEASHPNFKVLP